LERIQAGLEQYDHERCEHEQFHGGPQTILVRIGPFAPAHNNVARSLAQLQPVDSYGFGIRSVALIIAMPLRP
jgi:hypothetical protein